MKVISEIVRAPVNISELKNVQKLQNLSEILLIRKSLIQITPSVIVWKQMVWPRFLSYTRVMGFKHFHIY